MSLVQYDSSSSEDEDESPVTKIAIDEPNQPININSIANFLPQPKNRTPPRKNKTQSSTLAVTDAEPIVVNKRVSAFIPTSVKINALQKAKDAESRIEKVEEQPQKKILNVFQSVARTKRRREEDTGIKVVHDYHDESEEEEQITQSEEQTEEEPIKEFNVDEFYQSNIELKEKGQLQTNERLHNLTNNKNQLSSLIKNAQLDSDVLASRIDQRKKFKKEKNEKYGW